MRRQKGLDDISYCNTNCMNENCERNLRFRKPPTKYYSVCSFDTSDPDALHLKCEWKLVKKEDK